VALDHLSGGAKPLGRAIRLDLDCLGPWWTGSFMENPAFTRASLSNVRDIMMIIHVLVEELLCQTVMGRIPTLECLLSGTRGRLWLRPILPSIKWHLYPRTLTL
jgi:hypothetical protein